MPATFMLTFDCEGRWGIADHLTGRDRTRLTDEGLRQAYASIVALLDEYRVEATFAFVGAFAQSPAEFARLRPALEAFRAFAPDYVGAALGDLDASGGAGWHGDQLVDLVADARAGHEIALHGVTHVPWTQLGEDGVGAEMALFQSLAGPVGTSRTFVYPRNLVAHPDTLAKHGFAGFRLAPPKRSRALSLLAEFNIFETPERPADGQRIAPIPAGFFLNWRSGPRRLVPPWLTRLRAWRLLQAAAATKGIVHYWLHPENIATAPSTIDLLRMLVRDVAEARDAGHCQVLTQLGYCRSRDSLA
jgi:peptidoglycan/xylan/chitin deacetylase (PgdA/CDA1 family)